MLNGPAAVFVERRGRVTALDAPELTAEAVARAVVQLARPLGKDPLAEPIIDARLGDGSRVAICGPPAAPTAAITIRRFGGREFTLDELTAAGSLPGAVVERTAAVLGQERNVLISGGDRLGQDDVTERAGIAAAGWSPGHLHRGHGGAVAAPGQLPAAGGPESR